MKLAMTRPFDQPPCHSLRLAAAGILRSFSVASADSDDGIVRGQERRVPMAEAITRIKADIAGKGIKFFMEIDQSKLAADAGIKLRPSTLLVFGNPPLGTQFITSKSECRPRLAGPVCC